MEFIRKTEIYRRKYVSSSEIFIGIVFKIFVYLQGLSPLTARAFVARQRLRGVSKFYTLQVPRQEVTITAVVARDFIE